ncbi:MAG: prolyl oligopeptidase family serine peptidase [Treponema sp.]|nr:prolyl oligopeptidase family serine peptidase [Treponema sp.]
MNLKTVIGICIVVWLYTSCASHKNQVTQNAGYQNDQYFVIKTQCIPDENQYVLYVTGYDFGPAVDKVVIHTNRTLCPQDINLLDFEIEVVPKVKNTLGSIVKNFSHGERIVTDAYLSDGVGNRVELWSNYVTCTLAVEPENMWCNPFLNELVYKHWQDSYSLKIKNRALHLSLNKSSGMVSTLAGQFSLCQASYGGMTMHYASWEPPQLENTQPLLIWLHTVAEGGNDPYLPLLKCKVTSLITEEFQQYFADGLCVLVPQCPGNWLETTTTDFTGNRVWAPVDKDGVVRLIKTPFTFFGKKKDVNSAGIEEKTEAAYASVSYYTELLKYTIDQYLCDHPHIDRNRIYLMGASAGGYMVMNMCIQYPSYFAAAVPLCENYLNTKIADWQLNHLIDLPIWFVHARNDNAVDYVKYDMATYNRLVQSGAKNCHYTLFDWVENVDNIPTVYGGTEEYEYTGHSVWVNVFNNMCYEGDLCLMDWLSQQRLEN